MPRLSLSTIISALFVAFFCVDIARAQQPVGNLGGWPPGSFTLLVGLWVALDCLSTSRFDVLPPIIFARFLHMVPPLRRLLTLKTPVGNLTKRLVLISSPASSRWARIDHEWDALIVQPGKEASIEWGSSGDTLTIKISDREKDFELEIKTGIDADKYIKAAPIVIEEFSTEHLVSFQRRLYALQLYVNDPQQITWPEGVDRVEKRLEDAIRYFKSKMVSRPDVNEPAYDARQATGDEGQLASDDDVDDVDISAHFPDSQCGPNELPFGSGTVERVLTARQLAVMLAHAEFVCGHRQKAPHPLLLWIYSWINRASMDNVVIDYPLSKLHFQHSRHTPTKATLDLSSDEWYLDGGTNDDRQLFYRLLIALSSLLSAFVITFFAILAGSPPMLATSLGLLFSRPHVSFTSLFNAAPPSWNGHTRIRWGNGYSAGFFRGSFYRSLGSGGNGRFKASTVWIASWITWYFKTPLRRLLQFSDRQPSSPWVSLVASFLQLLLSVTVLIVFIANLYRFSRSPSSTMHSQAPLPRTPETTLALGIFCGYFTASMALVLLRLIGLISLTYLFYFSEFGVFLATPLAAIIPAGVAPSYFPFFLLNAFVWFNVIASSCYALS